MGIGWVEQPSVPTLFVSLMSPFYPHMGSLGFTVNRTSYLFGLSFDIGTGIHLLFDPGGARCQNRTALLVPKTRVLPLHFILHINGAPCRNRTHFWCLQNNGSNHWANGAYIPHQSASYGVDSVFYNLQNTIVGFFESLVDAVIILGVSLLMVDLECCTPFLVQLDLWLW